MSCARCYIFLGTFAALLFFEALAREKRGPVYLGCVGTLASNLLFSHKQALKPQEQHDIPHLSHALLEYS